MVEEWHKNKNNEREGMKFVGRIDTSVLVKRTVGLLEIGLDSMKRCSCLRRQVASWTIEQQ